MSSTRSTAKSPRLPKGSDREQTALEQKNARARKREALGRFVEKNAKVLAELAK